MDYNTASFSSRFVTQFSLITQEKVKVLDDQSEEKVWNSRINPAYEVTQIPTPMLKLTKSKGNKNEDRVNKTVSSSPTLK